MKTKKACPAAKTIETIAATKKEYNGALALKRAKLSGIALKASTVSAGGRYSFSPVSENGTSFVVSALAAIIGRPVFSGTEFSETIKKAETAGKERDFLFSRIKIYENLSRKIYGNLKTVISRLQGEIRRGNILSFAVKNGEEKEFSDIVKNYTGK